MADVLTPEQRSRCMAAIRGKNTKPEMVVRRVAHALGYRFRLHARDLPGRPDLVFRSKRKVVEVRGCFWHRHNCLLGRPVPATRPEFWKTKFAENVDRDRRNEKLLKQLGWTQLVVWECETQDTMRIAGRLVSYLKD